MLAPTPPRRLEGRTILQVVPALDAGGVERTAVDIAKAIIGAGGRALVASEGGRLEPELVAAGATAVRLPVASKNPAVMLANIARLARLVRREAVDIVHARSRAPAWSALAAARATGVRFVTTYAGIHKAGSAPKTFYNSVMARGDAVIANSGFTAAHIARHHGFAVPQTVVIHRGTDMALFDPAAMAPQRIAAMRAGWGVPAGVRVVLLPARLTAWKGHLTAIAALNTLPPDTVLVFAGDAQGRDDYVARLDAAAAPFGQRVKRVGHVTDMPAAIAAADVVAQPSTEPEAFGRVAVEAQAMGVPVVVADHGAVAETVITGEAPTGWRVPPGDAAALGAALGAALALPPAARQPMAERARAHVVARFSLEAMADATMDVYARLLAKGQ